MLSVAVVVFSQIALKLFTNICTYFNEILI